MHLGKKKKEEQNSVPSCQQIQEALEEEAHILSQKYMEELSKEQRLSVLEGNYVSLGDEYFESYNLNRFSRDADLAKGKEQRERKELTHVGKIAGSLQVVQESFSDDEDYEVHPVIQKNGDIDLFPKETLEEKIPNLPANEFQREFFMIQRQIEQESKKRQIAFNHKSRPLSAISRKTRTKQNSKYQSSVSLANLPKIQNESSMKSDTNNQVLTADREENVKNSPRSAYIRGCIRHGVLPKVRHSNAFIIIFLFQNKKRRELYKSADIDQFLEEGGDYYTKYITKIFYYFFLFPLFLSLFVVLVYLQSQNI